MVRFIHTYHGHIFHSYYGRLKTALLLRIERALARLNTHRIITLSARYDIRERGLTVASGDEDAFTAALDRLLADRDLRERLAVPGRAFVETVYSKERLVADIRRITRELAPS